MDPFLSQDFYFLFFACLAGLLLRPSGNLLELRYAFVIATVLGLCGESILMLATGDRLENVFTVPRFVPLVQRYAAVCVLMFWVGYFLSRWSRRPGTAAPEPEPSGMSSSPLIPLLLFATVPLFLDVLNYGVEHTFGTSQVTRGYYARLPDKPLTEYLRVLGKAISFPVAVVAGVAWQQRRQPALWLVPVLLSIPLVAQFSRGMFLPFVSFLLGVNFFVRGRRQYMLMAAAVGITLVSFVTGIAMRKYAANTGLALYSDFLQNDQMETTPMGSRLSQPLHSLVEATATLSVATKVFEVGRKYEGNKTAGYVVVQLPIPSFLLPKSVPRTNLADDLKLKGARFPYPLIGEMYVFFGWAGTLLFILVGWLTGRVDNAINDMDLLRRRSFLVAIFYGLVLFFIIRSFHSGLRSSFRPMMYFSGAWMAWYLLQRKPGKTPRPRDPVIERVKMLPLRNPAE